MGVGGVNFMDIFCNMGKRGWVGAQEGVFRKLLICSAIFFLPLPLPETAELTAYFFPVFWKILISPPGGDIFGCLHFYN